MHIDNCKLKYITKMRVKTNFLKETNFTGLKQKHWKTNANKGQVRKSIRWMPWHQEPTKDVTSCDKRRGRANIYRSVDVRMGKPTCLASIVW